MIDFLHLLFENSHGVVECTLTALGFICGIMLVISGVQLCWKMITNPDDFSDPYDTMGIR